MMRSLNRLTKWRTFFASWQLGTRPPEDGELRAIKHHLEMSMIMRAELSALVFLLTEKGVFTEQEWYDALSAEATALSSIYAKSFPGWKATDQGMSMKLPEARQTMQELGFPS
jgi:hypothetical protein